MHVLVAFGVANTLHFITHAHTHACAHAVTHTHAGVLTHSHTSTSVYIRARRSLKNRLVTEYIYAVKNGLVLIILMSLSCRTVVITLWAENAL